jgi:ribosomal protein S18 acetylase RimI-like enzyme
MMDHQAAFPCEIPGYSIRWLIPRDAPWLQRLFDRCPDYAEVVEGAPVSTTAAEELFQSLPPGGSFSDKLVIGIFDRMGEQTGVLDGMRHYPEENIWWIGLLLVGSETRSRGVGGKMTEAFIKYARVNGGKAVMLGVVEENRRAFQFWKKNGFELARTTEPRTFGKKTQAVFVLRREIQ